MLPIKNKFSLIIAVLVMFSAGFHQHADAADQQDNPAAAAVERTQAQQSELFTPYVEPIYRPIPDSVAGVLTPELLLDGRWQTRIVPEFSSPFEGTAPLDASQWQEIQIPGQFKEQGLLPGTSRGAHTVVFGAPDLSLSYSGLPVEQALMLEIHFYNPTGERRVQSLRVAGQVLLESFEQPEGQIASKQFTLPADTVSDDGNLTIEANCIEGPNATISGIEIRSAGAPAGETIVSEHFEDKSSQAQLGEGCGYWEFPMIDSYQAELVHDFTVPADWQGCSAALRFEAVHGEAKYYLNGKYLGSSAMVFLPTEFDVSDALAPGKTNRLVVQLTMNPEGMPDRLADASKYAMHNIGGVHRSVRLFAKPLRHLERLTLDGHVEKTLKAGELRLQTRLHGKPEQVTKLEVVATAPDGETHRKIFDVMETGKDVEIALPITNPVLWNAEKPRLYEVKVALLSEGRVLESLKRRVGFRRLEVIGSKLLVNGKRVKLAGANRHEVHPLTGRADTARWGRTDAELFKQANCNYIRTSHYPPTREFLEACDEVGLYVQCEAPFVWVANSTAEDPAALNWFLNPAAAMLEYHGSNPSVIIWSLANESGYLGEDPNELPDNFIKMNAFVQERDPSRPTTFNNQMNHDGGRCDIGNSHYNTPVNDLDAYLVDPDDPRPILIDEMFHINTYNYEELTIDPGMREEWSRGIYRFGGNDTNPHWEPNAVWHRIYHSERWLGAAIWGGIDEIFVLDDGRRVGYGAWGIIDGWRRKKPEWWLTKKLYTPVWLVDHRSETLADGGLAVTLVLENRYSFTNLDELHFVWRAGGKELTMDGPSIAPATSGEWLVRLPAVPNKYWSFEAVGDDGTPIVSYGLHPEECQPADLSVPSNGAPAIKQNATRIEMVFSENAHRDSDLPNITLSALPEVFISQVEGKMIFTPKSFPYEEFPGSAKREIEVLTTEYSEQNATLTLQESVGDFQGGITWDIDTTGRSILEYNYTYTGPDRNIREAGICLQIPAEAGEIRWRGGGNWNMYPEAHIGRGDGAARFDFPSQEETRWDHLGSYYGPTPPTWAWEQDVNAFGPTDFRATKFNVREAQWHSDKGTGMVFTPVSDANRFRIFHRDGQLIMIISQNETSSLQAGDKIAGRLGLNFVSTKGELKVHVDNQTEKEQE